MRSAALPPGHTTQVEHMRAERKELSKGGHDRKERERNASRAKQVRRLPVRHASCPCNAPPLGQV
eukprot:SAG22_NODE_1166_length_5291_cov_4.322227_4_plen_65_part_00